VSEPSATGTIPDATAAPEPDDEPREAFEIPRIARGRPRQVERRARVRHLVRGKLAEQHRARLVEAAHRRRVVTRDAIHEHARVAGGEDAARVIDVLQAERNAVQRAAIFSARDLGLGSARLRPRQLERGRDERARLGVEILDASDQRVDQR
jgi:hypothetical protein